MINLPPKPVMKAEALKKVNEFATMHRSGESIPLNDFFGVMLLYATSATPEDLSRLLRVNMAEVLKHQEPIRKFDA